MGKPGMRMLLVGALALSACARAAGTPIEHSVAGYRVEKRFSDVFLRDVRTGYYLIRAGQ